MDRNTFSSFNGAVADLYAAALNEASWDDALRSVQQLFSAEACFIRLATGDAPRDQFAAFSGYSVADLEEYARDFAHEDYWTIEGVPKVAASGVPMTGDALASRDKIDRSGMLNDFLAPRGVTDCLAIPIDKHGDQVSLLVLNGAGDGGRFRSDHVMLAEHLAPHLARSVAQRNRFGGALTPAEVDRLEAIGVGLAVFDDRGRPIAANRAFERACARAGVFRKGAGVPFCESNAAIRSTIEAAIAAGASKSVALRRGDGSRHVLRVMPAPACAPGVYRDGRVAVTLECLDGATERAAQIAVEAWALTRREAELVGLLTRHVSARAAAARMGVSYETIRSHLKTIYGKSGARSLTELVAAASAVRLDDGGSQRGSEGE